jgi:hypothetical protein
VLRILLLLGAHSKRISNLHGFRKLKEVLKFWYMHLFSLIFEIEVFSFVYFACFHLKDCGGLYI